jgi:hypothetical protein
MGEEDTVVAAHCEDHLHLPSFLTRIIKSQRLHLFGVLQDSTERLGRVRFGEEEMEDLDGHLASE